MENLENKADSCEKPAKLKESWKSMKRSKWFIPLIVGWLAYEVVTTAVPIYAVYSKYVRPKVERSAPKVQSYETSLVDDIRKTNASYFAESHD